MSTKDVLFWAMALAEILNMWACVVEKELVRRWLILIECAITIGVVQFLVSQLTF